MIKVWMMMMKMRNIKTRFGREIEDERRKDDSRGKGEQRGIRRKDRGQDDKKEEKRERRKRRQRKGKNWEEERG